MTMTWEEFSRCFENSPIKRVKCRGPLHNVAIALDDWGSPETVPALALWLNDEAGAGARTRGVGGGGADRHGGSAAGAVGREEVEEDVWVREKIAAGLDGS